MSGVKNDQGKAPISLIPSEFIIGTAEVFAFGGTKYGLHNYRQGIAWSRLVDAAMRHLLAINAGEWKDTESGLPHLYHTSCCLAMLSYMHTHYPELNDVYELIKERK